MKRKSAKLKTEAWALVYKDKKGKEHIALWNIESRKKLCLHSVPDEGDRIVKVRIEEV